MEAGEKKIKQSILFIALFLLLCGYYSSQKPDDSTQLENSKSEIETIHTNIENKVQSEEPLIDNVKNEEFAGS